MGHDPSIVCPIRNPTSYGSMKIVRKIYSRPGFLLQFSIVLGIFIGSFSIGSFGIESLGGVSRPSREKVMLAAPVAVRSK